MNKFRLISAIVIVSVLSFNCGGGNMVDKLINAREKLTAVERPNKLDPKLTLEKAYTMQKELVSKLIKNNKEIISGYKLSPNTVNGEPVYGYLFKSMFLPDGATIKKSNFIDLHLENEVVFIIGKEILPSEINKASDLKKYVSFIAPGVEMPEIRYLGSIDDVTGLDLVVDNVVASKVIMGQPISSDKINADNVKIKMLRNNEIINEGTSTMVEGSPWNSLHWLVKELAKKNETLKPGQIIFTGGIAKFMDSLPGEYEAKYGDLGKITFKIE